MANIIKSNNDFKKIIAIIEQSKAQAIKAINAEMIEMYWQIGKCISEKTANDGWGKSIVQEFSNFIKHTYPMSSGFSAQNIWRMKQFYETYRNKKTLTTGERNYMVKQSAYYQDATICPPNRIKENTCILHRA